MSFSISGQRKYDIPHSNTFRKALAYSFLWSVQWIQSKAAGAATVWRKNMQVWEKYFNEQ